jgi:hypothetical protein
MIIEIFIFTAEAQSARSLFFFMFSAETPENIKSHRQQRMKTNGKCKVYL